MTNRQIEIITEIRKTVSPVLAAWVEEQFRSGKDHREVWRELSEARECVQLASA